MTLPRFPGYRVERAIGSGALSTIYLAERERGQLKVAIKALKPSIAPTSPLAEQLEREARALSLLSHPRVVMLLEAHESGVEQPYLVLEHVDGFTLRELLHKRPRLRPERAIAIAVAVLEGLDHAHERGVVHRDVKPQNVMLSRRGDVKLVDFGIADVLRAPDATRGERLSSRPPPPSREASEAIGTPAYMSPEQILGDFADARSDVYSVGVMLYQCLAGARPNDHGDERRRGERPKHRRDAVPLRERAPSVSRSLEHVVMRMLQKNPRDRYADAEEARVALEEELRSLSREPVSRLVIHALAEASLIKPTARSTDAGSSARRAPTSLGRTVLVFASIGATLAAGLLAIELPARANRGPLSAEGRAPLELAPARAGGLRVVATPWAEVWVDGAKVETTPFAKAIPLEQGAHYVRLVHPDSPVVEQKVAVVAGETVTLEVVMPLAGDGGAVEEPLQAETP